MELFVVLLAAAIAYASWVPGITLAIDAPVGEVAF
jgi:hypothetical protein